MAKSFKAEARMCRHEMVKNERHVGCQAIVTYAVPLEIGLYHGLASLKCCPSPRATLGNDYTSEP